MNLKNFKKSKLLSVVRYQFFFFASELFGQPQKSGGKGGLITFTSQPGPSKTFWGCHSWELVTRYDVTCKLLQFRKNKYQIWNAYLFTNQGDNEHITLSDINKATPRLKVTRLREVSEKCGKVNKLCKGRQTILATHVVQCHND